MSEAADLRKLAAILRETAKKHEDTSTQKCASIVVSAIGLEFLKRKIYGES